MKQLSIFDIFDKPIKRQVLPEPNITPTTDDEYQMLLGVRYSLTKVEGWLAVYALCIYRPPEKHPVLPYSQTAWVDPSTIERAIGNKNLRMAWGFGPRHEINRYTYEMISFDFQDYSDYDWVRNDRVLSI